MRTSNVTYLVKKGISSVWKNLLMSFASFSILMVSLLLVGCSVLLMMNVNTIMKNIEDTNEIAIYLGEDVTQKQKDHIRRRPGKERRDLRGDLPLQGGGAGGVPRKHGRIQ